jgi:SPP1 family predicted phage head-tail adaptor
MNPGILRHKIIITKPPTGYNGFGQPLTEWVIVRTVKAAINPAIGRNYYAADQTQTDAKIKINTRYYPDIKKNMRITHKDKVYDIIDAQDVEMRHEELVIYCNEVVS